MYAGLRVASSGGEEERKGRDMRCVYKHGLLVQIQGPERVKQAVRVLTPGAALKEEGTRARVRPIARRQPRELQAHVERKCEQIDSNTSRPID